MNLSMLLWDRLRKQRLLAQVAPKGVEECLNAYEILNPLGVTLEVLIQSPEALLGIREIKQKHPDALVLAGQVLTHQETELAIEAGAAGICSLDYIPIVVEVCARKDVMCIPSGTGDLGKQLVQKARFYNCELDELRTHYPYQWIYRLFPAMAAAPVHLESAAAIRPFYKDLTLLYSGGITRENLQEVTRRDHTSIISTDLLRACNSEPESLQKEVEQWLAIIHNREMLTQPERVETEEVQVTPIPVEDQDESIQRHEDADRVVTFGEVLLRLSTPQGSFLDPGVPLESAFTGSESNVAIALAQMGSRTRHVTALPDHPVGEAALKSLLTMGVDTSSILSQGKRVGICFSEKGSAGRYFVDQEASSFSELKPEQIDWSTAFRDAQWFHYSTNSSALDENGIAVMLEALQAAKQAQLTVSCDLSLQNQPSALEKAREGIQALLAYTDIAMGTEEDFMTFFGLSQEPGDSSHDDRPIDTARVISREMHRRFKLKLVAVLARENQINTDNRYLASLFNGKDFYCSQAFTLSLGQGIEGRDAFTSGLIHSLLVEMDDQAAIEFVAAVSSQAQSLSDMLDPFYSQEVEALAVSPETEEAVP